MGRYPISKGAHVVRCLTTTLPLVVASLVSLVLAGVGVLPVSSAKASDLKGGGMPLTYLTSVHIPGAPSSGWCRDVAAVSTDHYYLADDTNKQVSIIDIKHDGRQDRFAGALGHNDFNGQAGCANFDFSREAPEGVLAYGGKLWVSNVFVDASGVGHSQILVFGQGTGELLKTISTGGQKRADEMTVIPTLGRAGLLAVTNPDETFDVPPEAPWLNFIDMATYKVVAKLPFPNATAGMSGLQQPAWIGGNQLLEEVPSPVGNVTGGELDSVEVDSAHGAYSPHVTHRYPLVNCQPAGLNLDWRSGLAAVGCGYIAPQGSPPGQQAIWDFRHNKLVTYLPGIQGVDIVATARTAHGVLFLFPSYASNQMYVADVHGQVLQQTSTSDLAHTVNVDPETGQVFLPVGGGVVAVYGTREG